jgi:hypothetical protein
MPHPNIQWPVWEAPSTTTNSSSSSSGAPSTWDVPGQQEQDSSGEGLPVPLLCIKRTYQPHTARRKKKHGFLKR